MTILHIAVLLSCLVAGLALGWILLKHEGLEELENSADALEEDKTCRHKWVKFKQASSYFKKCKKCRWCVRLGGQ